MPCAGANGVALAHGFYVPIESEGVMAGKYCDVCGNPSIGVASSSLGAMSLAYCKWCVRNSFEPYYALVGFEFCVGFKDEDMSWLQRNLLVVGKTLENLRDDAIKLQQNYEKELNGTG